MKVLLIGCDRDIVEMTEKILRRNGYGVISAVGKEEALRCLCDRECDLVVMDCDMAEPDRDRLIVTVKGMPDAPLLLAISGDREDEIPLLTAGADDWVGKPYQMDVLLARMAVLLRQKKQ